MACSLFCLPITLSSSTYQISGNTTISCFPSTEVYRIFGFEENDAPDENAIWQWEVQGGLFQNGKTKIEQKVKDYNPVEVHWRYNTLPEGKIILKYLMGSQIIFSTSKIIAFGLPQPNAIIVEDGLLNCEGNWFIVNTSFPLSNNEIVEWRVVNGLDENGVSVDFIQKKGEEANRVYLKKDNPNLPLEINVRIQSDCGISSTSSIPVTERFQNPRKRIVGPVKVKAKKENTFYTCPVLENETVKWNTTGTITDVGFNSVNVSFPEKGAQTLEMIVEDCQGSEKQILLPIEVVIADGDNNIIRTGEYPDKLGFRVFPNPAENGIVTIELSDFKQEGTIELISLHGRRIQFLKIPGKTVNLSTSGVNPGIYIIRIVTGQNESVSRISIN